MASACCCCADPDFDKALLCTFQFEKPQQLKVAVFSRNKLNLDDSTKDSMLGGLPPPASAHLHAHTPKALQRAVSAWCQ